MPNNRLVYPYDQIHVGTHTLVTGFVMAITTGQCASLMEGTAVCQQELTTVMSVTRIMIVTAMKLDKRIVRCYQSSPQVLILNTKAFL